MVTKIANNNPWHASGGDCLSSSHNSLWGLLGNHLQIGLPLSASCTPELLGSARAVQNQMCAAPFVDRSLDDVVRNLSTRLVIYHVIEDGFELHPGDFGLEEDKLANSSSSNCRWMQLFHFIFAYLGKHDSPESIARYAVLIGIYQAGGLKLPDEFEVATLDARAAVLLGAAGAPVQQSNEPLLVRHITASYREHIKV